jgi:hypothetical protein
MVQSSLNHTPMASLNGLAPVTVFTGLAASTPLDAIFSPGTDITSGLIDNSETVVDLVQNATTTLHESLSQMHKQLNTTRDNTNYDDRGKQTANFMLGDFVLVAKTIKPHRGHKLQASWYGPMQVTKLCTPWIFEVTDLLSKKLSKVHSQRLKFYADSSLEITEELKLQLQHDGEGFDIECILNHRIKSGRWEFYISWAGFTEQENTWEPVLQLYADIPTYVKEYLHSLKAKTAADKRVCKRICAAIKNKYSSFSME